MDDVNIKTIHQEESLATITKENLNPKQNDLENSKSNDTKNPKIENTPLKIKDDFDEKDCIWGIKQSGNKYKSVTIKNELYALNDCVCCRSGLELDYIGKIMKLSQENDQKVCTLRWFFRLFELPTSLKEVYKAIDTRELFLAFGDGIGVENQNSLGVIIRKCKVLCTAKDDFNDLPSSEHLNMCDFFFSKAFNCDTSQIIGLDGVVDAIGAQKVYNKKEWLNWNKSNMQSTSLTSSPMKTFCHSYGSQTLPTNSNDVNILSLGHHNSSSTITRQPTKKTLEKKRKRNSLEKKLPSMEKIKKIKLSSPLKNPKLSVTMTFTKHEDQATKLESEVRSIVTVVDAPNIGMSSSKPEFTPNIYESFKNGKIDENLKNYIDLSNSVSMILEQSIEKVGNNADDIHVTCEGFPKETIVEPSEKSESSISKPKKDENSPHFMIEVHGISEIGESHNSTKNKVKNKTTSHKGQKMTSKVVQNKKIKKSSTFIIDIAEEKLTKTKFVNCNVSKRPQNKRKKVINEKTQDQILDILCCDKFEKNCEDVVKEHEVDCIKDQQLLRSPLSTTRSLISGENLIKEEYNGCSQSIENIKSAIEYNIAIPFEQNFEPECKDWNDEIQMAIKAKRILLLHNIDPKLHSIELQEVLSKILGTKCQVQKIIPSSFYYTTGIASALLKFLTQDKAQKSLQNLNKDCLIVGERVLIATLYEDLEFANELYCFYGHICIQPKCEMLENNPIEMDLLPHVAQGNTIEFTYGLQWRLLQEQHELQWQLLNEFHEKELNLLSKECKTNKQLRKSK